VRVDEVRGAGVFMNRNTDFFEMLAPGSMFAYILYDLAGPCEKPRIVQDRLAHGDSEYA
jgi:hypothetical protein